MTRIMSPKTAQTTQGEIRLEDAEFFRALDPKQLDGVRAQLRERPLQRGKVLYFVGEPADYLWCVATGETRVYRSSKDGRITTLETLGPGNVFGAISALDDDVYPVSAEGVVDGFAWCLHRSHFLQLMKEDSNLTREVLGIITRRLHSAHERVRSFAHDPAPSRIAQALQRASRDGLRPATFAAICIA
jgi:CRP-like cAMP-binding protein